VSILRFSVQLTESAEDDLNHIPIEIRKEILFDVQRLSSAPFPPGTQIKKLKGFKPPLYRLRAGDYRIIYRVEAGTVFIMRVINRKELERIIKRLKF
jgi:mRNA interferase RelE/StbE